MRPSSLLHAIGRPIAFNPGLVPVFGSVNSVLFFGQIYFWMNHTQNPLGVYKSADEILTETGLSYREQATARAKLVDLGVLIETHKRLEHRIYFRIDVDALDALLADYLDSISRNDKSAVREQTKAQSVEKTKAQSVCSIQRLPVSTAVDSADAPAAAPVATPKQEAPAYMQTERVLVDPARKQVEMTMDWQPDDTFPAVLMRSGVNPASLTNDVLSKFRVHHLGEQMQQNRWQSKLLAWVKREKAMPAKPHTSQPPLQHPPETYGASPVLPDAVPITNKKIGGLDELRKQVGF